MSHDPIYFAPQRKLGGGWLVFKSSPSPPPAPDYAGAASATASGNLQAAQQAQQANLVNQNTPYGSLTYSEDPTSRFSSGNPSYSSQINLSPTGQQLLDYSNNAAVGLGSETGQALNRVDQTLAQPFNYGSVNDLADQSYAQQTARLDPQWAQNDQLQASTLANQGITQGSEAYNNAMRTYGQQKNDAYTQARITAQNTMPQNLQLSEALRSQPLNELNALRTGSQVTTPQFGATPQQATTQGANLLGAATSTGQYNQGLYNANVGAQNATTSGLFGLGSAAIPFMF